MRRTRIQVLGSVIGRILVVLSVVLAVAWVGVYSDQWMFRRRAEALLADVRSIEIGQTSQSAVQPLLKKWRGRGEITFLCGSEGCEYGVMLRHNLPQMMMGYPDKGVRNVLPRLINHLALRSMSANAWVRVNGGAVTLKGFGMDVSRPVEVWFDRGGAYVPDLLVSSSEIAKFNGDEGNFNPEHPHHVSRNFKGPYGVMVTFTPEELPTEREALMGFSFACVTRISPCIEEREILPEGSRVLEEGYASLRSSNASAIKE